MASGRWSVGTERFGKVLKVRVQSYRELIAWQKAMDLAEGVYQGDADFSSKDELYGMTSQLRTCSGFDLQQHR